MKISLKVFYVFVIYRPELSGSYTKQSQE